MHIGLLTYGLDRNLTGISRYTIELGRALTARRGTSRLTLLAAGGLGPLAINGCRSVHLHGCAFLPGLMTMGNALIARTSQRLDLDLVHDPTGVTPFLLGAGRARTVVTVHDVFARSCPGTSTRLDSLIYRCWLPRVLPKVAAVITASDRSRSDILGYLDVPPSRVRVIPLGVANQFRLLSAQEARRSVRDRFGLDRPYLLYVGALTRRKNLERAVQAFAVVAKEFPEHLFVLAGQQTYKGSRVEEEVGRLGLGDRVVFIRSPADADLPALYNAAELFVFPSLYEGFGLPPLEAMACGTPVVCSNTAALPEVVGTAALTVDPYDVEGLAAAMHRSLSDKDLRQELSERGLARARRFTWERTARDTVNTYREVVCS